MEKLFSVKNIVAVGAIAMFYIAVVVSFLHHELLLATLGATYSFATKVSILTGVLGGIWVSMGVLGAVLFICTAFLTGANLVLAVGQLRDMHSRGPLGVVVGGGSFVGIAATGCASCGLPLFAFLGIGGAVSSLPFHGIEVSLVAILLLSISLFILIKQRNKPRVCVV